MLDLLHQVKWYQDGTLTFRRSCAHGVCGSDAMLINGRNRLACEYLVRDAGTRIAVEPIRGMGIVKDLLAAVEHGPTREAARASSCSAAGRSRRSAGSSTRWRPTPW